MICSVLKLWLKGIFGIPILSFHICKCCICMVNCMAIYIHIVARSDDDGVSVLILVFKVVRTQLYWTSSGSGRHLWERLAYHKRDIKNRNRDSPVAEHFRDHDVQANDILCTIIDNSPSDKNVRKRLEEAWIRIMTTMNPTGMNLKMWAVRSRPPCPGNTTRGHVTVTSQSN